MLRRLVATASFFGCVGLILGIPSAASARCVAVGGGAFDCEGGPVILGEPGDEDVLPDVRIEFALAGGTLEVTLIYEGASSASTGGDTMILPRESLAGVLFSVTDLDVVLTAVEAEIEAGSVLTEGVSDPGNTLPSIAGQWAAKGRRFNRRGAIVGQIQAGTLGVFDYAVGCAGDINATGADEDKGNHTLGKRDLINRTTNLGHRKQPGGADFCIVPPNQFVDLSITAFDRKGPLVQNAVTITYDVDGSLDLSEIEDVVPLFGTEGLSLASCYE